MEALPDLRGVGSHPDFWYPVAQSAELRRGRVLGAAFAGQPIALARTASGEAFALEDRCAHRQVPLSLGVVAGGRVRCGYHGWSYDETGRCVDVPYLCGDRASPHRVRSYPCREAYGLAFIFPGDPAKAKTTPLPAVPAALDPGYRVRTLDRRIACHYTFMHENLMDMNHQFLHRRWMGDIRTTLLSQAGGKHWYEARYTFSRAGGTGSLGERLIIGAESGPGATDVMTVRTEYPYQVLTYRRAGKDRPALDLWLAYVPLGREQRVTRSFGLMCIRKPSVPGLIKLFWPFIVGFTDRIFGEDQAIMEAEQRAWDAQGADRNQEPFPVIRGLREVLRRSGVPPSI